MKLKSIVLLLLILSCAACSHRRAIASEDLASESLRTLRAASAMEERIVLAELSPEAEQQALTTTRQIRNSVKAIDQIIDTLAGNDLNEATALELESSFRTFYRHHQAMLEQPPRVFASRGFDEEEFEEFRSQLDAMLQAAKSLR